MTELAHPPTVISVMGTGRSGTSLITKYLNILGVYLGPDACFMAPSPDNPKGYYELMPIFELNEQILAVLDGKWYCPPKFFEGWERSDRLSKHRAKARDLIDRLFGKEELWAWKDPRSCWLLPFWRLLMPPMRYIFALRNPLDVARSLERSAGLGFEYGMTYWLKALNEAMQHTSGQERLFVFYEDVLDHPEQELMRMARFIGREAQALKSDLLHQARQFVEKKLHRNRTTPSEVLIDSGVTYTAQSLYMVLRAYVNAGGGSFDRELDLFGRHTLGFQDNLDHLVDRLMELEPRSRKPISTSR